MAKYKYTRKMEETHIGKAVFRDIGISTKAAIEISTNIRHKTVEKAKSILQAIISLKTPIKYYRFTEGAGHKSSVSGPGKFPVKAAEQILKVVKSAESNANDKGLSSGLKIVHLAVQRASTPWRYGRQKRRKSKRTHIEVFVKESESKKTVKSIKPEKKLVTENKSQSKENIKSEVEIKQEVKQEIHDNEKNDITKSKVISETKDKK